MLAKETYNRILNEIYNIWFRKWRDAPPKSNIDWDRCNKEAEAIYRKYPYQLVADLCADFYAELNRRNKEKGENNGQ
jgi:hypothetical protein